MDCDSVRPSLNLIRCLWELIEHVRKSISLLVIGSRFPLVSMVICGGLVRVLENEMAQCHFHSEHLVLIFVRGKNWLICTLMVMNF